MAATIAVGVTTASAVPVLLSFAVAVAIAGGTVVLLVHHRDSPVLTTLGAGVSLGLFIAALAGYRIGASETSPPLPIESVATMRAIVDSDAFIDGRVDRRLRVRPRLVATRGGTACSGASLFASRVYVFTSLDRPLYRGEIVEFFGLEAVPGHEESLPTAFAAEGFTRAGWKSAAARVRAYAFDAVDTLRLRLGPYSRSLFGALFLGVSDERLDDVRYFLRRAGCIHLFALSGMHVAIVIGLAVAVLSPFLGKRIASLVAVPVICAYVYLIGAPPSLLRSGLMFTLAAVFSGFGRRVRSVDIVATALLVGVAVQPTAVTSLSFQLTYLAVLGIVIGGGKWTTCFRRFLPAPAASGFGIAVAAYLSTAWRVAFVFSYTYPFGVAASVVLGPFVAVFLCGGIIVLAAGVSLPRDVVRLDVMYELLEVVGRSFIELAGFFARFPRIGLHPFVLLGLSAGLWWYVMIRFGGDDQL